MPRSIETLVTRRAAQLKALAQVRNTLPASDRAMVADLFEACSAGAGLSVANMQDWQLELIGTLANTYLNEAVKC